MLRKLINSPWLYFALAAVLLAVAAASQFRRFDVEAPEGGVEDVLALREEGPYNVVFILIDTLRADRLSAYGYRRQTSPNLDALAARGIRFANVESQSSWTKASMASMWTGLYPQRTGVMRFAHALPPDALLPAEIFRDAGYRTAGVWRNGWVANNFGFDQGFDLYFRPAKNRPVKNVRRHNPSSHALIGTDLDTTESAAEFVLGVGDAPFFLYVHYMDVHQYLYADTSPHYGTGFSDIYDSSIHWTDQNVGLLVDVLRNEGLLDRTWIVVASDHGEAFFEHGGEGHARTLYGEVQQVPLLIAPPISLAPGLVVEERVANVDIWPTVLDLLGLPPLPDAEGRSLVPLIEAAAGLREVPEDLAKRPVFAQLDRSWGRATNESDPLVSVVKDDFRMLHQVRRPNRPELYDKSVDPREQRNVVNRRREVAEDLTKDVESFLEGGVPWGATPEIEVDEMRAAQLRALGYVVPSPNQAADPKPKAAPPQGRKWGED